MATYSLNTTDRIAALEKELFQLRKRNKVFDGIKLPTLKKPIQGVPKILVREPNETASRVALAAPVTCAVAPSSSSQSTSPSPPPLQPVASTKHPFTAARDATYALPNLQNFDAALKANPDKEKEPSYRTLTPAYRPKMIKKVFERSMKSPFVTLSPEELLSISPDLRSKYHDLEVPDESVSKIDVHSLTCHRDPLSPNATILPDPYESYLKCLLNGVLGANLTVVKESNAIRYIEALIDNQQCIKCIIDPSSQIIAMSQEICHMLGLAYDPMIKLNMQSANRTMDQSLGLIHNLPMQSIVKNFSNKDQTITLVCPNLGKTMTVPTKPQGKPRFMGKVAVVIEYDDTGDPHITSYATIPSIQNEQTIPALYLSACDDVFPYLQSLYTKDASNTSSTSADAATWASSFLAAADFPIPKPRPVVPHSISVFSQAPSATSKLSLSPSVSPHNISLISSPNLVNAPIKSQNSYDTISFDLDLPKLMPVDADSDDEDKEPIYESFAGTKYKPVALKTWLVLGAVDEQFRIWRNIKGNPLETIPKLSKHPLLQLRGGFSFFS
ncbi:uncharacterized protein FIBRA_08780 [Fibroporia radiculosa]|uniref:Uncharacterized protein n=1 Tax=Fibroporia radiculosa TaxID=599839 RepID=J4H5C7_9APHY|nr:uncharacterized protein FIBRA_08780 [Fibroporia radiculosa]CCM06509.1 predicted protein [Fibroporia radiculosa]